jgi:hypothetical protein
MRRKTKQSVALGAACLLLLAIFSVQRADSIREAVASRFGPRAYDFTINLRPGDTMDQSVHIKSGDGKIDGTVLWHVEVLRKEGDTYVCQATLDKLTITGQDATDRLRTEIGTRPVLLRFSEKSRNRGTQGFQLRGKDAGVYAVLRYASMVNPQFSPSPVNVGDHWSAMTIAWNNCVSANYLFTKAEDNVAHFQLTDIALTTGKFEEPSTMTMAIDTGMVLDYTFVGFDKAAKRTITVHQKMESFARG